MEASGRQCQPYKRDNFSTHAKIVVPKIISARCCAFPSTTRSGYGPVRSSPRPSLNQDYGQVLTKTVTNPRTTMKVACVQFFPQLGQVQENVERVRNLTAKIRAEQVDLLVLPEMALTGTSCVLTIWAMHMNRWRISIRFSKTHMKTTV